MSHDEQIKQNETINIMAEQLKTINKYMKYAPLFGVIGTLLSGAFALGIFLYKYDVSVVKQPQFTNFKTTVTKVDSTLNAKVDTNNMNINRRIDNLPILRLVNVTQHKDKYGNITYPRVN